MVIINWSGSSNNRLFSVDSWILPQCNSGSGLSPLCLVSQHSSSSLENRSFWKVGNLSECWALPTGRANRLDCTDSFMQCLPDIVQYSCGWN